jgi:hypothetical protein
LAATYRIAERATEALYEDEALRSKLTDREAQIILKWATDWITDRASAAQDEASAEQIVTTETARVRDVIRALNDPGKSRGASALVRMVTALEPLLHSGKPFSREEALSLATVLMTAAWKM